MNIAFLDSGIEVTHPVFAGRTITQTVYHNGAWLREDAYQPVMGHGTGVASILVKNADNFAITSFVLFEEGLSAPLERYISALDYILQDGTHYDLIHMSVSVRIYNRKLEELCEALHKKGSVLVGAFDNSGYLSYPAGFPTVIGVDASTLCKTSTDYLSLEGPVDLLAKGGSQRVAWLNKGYTVMQGSSFAAAYISAYSIQALQKGIELSALFPLCQCLKIKPPAQKRADCLPANTIRKAVVFPYNKETSSLVRFSELLPFELVALYDTKLSGNLGRTIKRFDESGQQYKVQNIDTCDFETFDSFDTFIMGHTHDLEYFSKQSIRKPLIEQCIKNKKNMFCFDHEYIDESIQSRFSQSGIELMYPASDFPLPEKLGKLYYVNTPVLGIFGTSSQQGKYTLQLYLRKYFLQAGYVIGQLGSEPESLLFGMDTVYAYGFRGITLSGYKSIEYLNHCMAVMDRKDYDLLIVGAQSGTIPLQYSCLNTIPLESINFLLGTRPDAIILCVNYHDKIEDIKRTIAALESLGKTKIIACCVFPQGYVSQWDMIRGVKGFIEPSILEVFVQNLYEALAIPCYSNDKHGAEALYQASINFFAVKG
ncbi:MAG: S8 family serine peptidase [Spirochaetaceae bacterium]|jgi:hypothetical protein|nr:S8 family serine peptidase [Spirochaetaceae bacterium]